jgi:hypothetical protein
VWISSASGRDALIALSLSNLCYLRVWTELLTYQRHDTYLMKLPPGPAAMLAAMTNVVLLAAALWIAAAWARQTGSKRVWAVAEWGFLLSLALPLNALRAVLTRFSGLFKSTLFEVLGTKGVLVLAVVLAAGGCLSILLFRSRLVAAAAAVLAMLSPFCAVTFAQAIWKIVRYHPAEFANRPSEPLVPAVTDQHVVWFVCDEWDYRLTFVDRNASLSLPEIDKLRAESLFAEHALPPGPETPVSIPSYFIGRLVEHVDYQSPRDTDVYYQGEKNAAPWSQQPSIFARAHDLGFNTAAVEWFHPTCRVLRGMAYCDWWPLALQSNSMGETFAELLPNQTRSLFETTLLSPFGPSLSQQAHLRTYRTIMDASLGAISNKNYNLTFVHLPVPHAPHAYNNRTNRFDLANAPIKGYTDSLALLDLTLGEFRRSMEHAGTWDSSTVLITSDHPYREARLLDGKSDPRIPWLLKLPRQQQGCVYSREFNTVLTQDLLLAVLKDEFGDAAGAKLWLDRK